MVITEQTAFPFSEFWVILNFFSLCWSSGQFSLVCSLLSLNQYFVFFIIRKIKITRDESLQSLATSEFFMASQSAVSFFLCFFFPSTISFALISRWLPNWCLWSYPHLIHLSPWSCACGQLQVLPILRLFSDLFPFWNLSGETPVS